MIKDFFRKKKEQVDGPSIYYLLGFASAGLLLFGLLDSSEALFSIALALSLVAGIIFLIQLAWKSKYRIRILHLLALAPLVGVVCFVLYILYAFSHMNFPKMAFCPLGMIV